MAIWLISNLRTGEEVGRVVVVMKLGDRDRDQGPTNDTQADQA